MKNTYYIATGSGKADITNDSEGIKNRQQALEALSTKCEKCGSTDDLMIMFTEVKICGKCIRKQK